MKRSMLTVLSAAAAAALLTGVATAAPYSVTDPYENFSSSWARSTPPAYPAASEARFARAPTSTPLTAQTIVVDGTRAVVDVAHLSGAIEFVDARGHSFVWQSKGPGTFPLKAVAPAGFESAGVWVAVVHPRDHTTR